MQTSLPCKILTTDCICSAVNFKSCQCLQNNQILYKISVKMKLKNFYLVFKGFNSCKMYPLLNKVTFSTIYNVAVE